MKIALTDTLGVTDSVTKRVDYLRTQNDAIGTLDTMIRVSVAIRSINDSMNITDAEDVTAK